MYYTYAYLNSQGKPYYVGKGKGDRCYYNGGRNCNTPKDRKNIIKLKQNLTEEEAFRHEVYMISVLGKKCDETGMLRNISDGGNAPPTFYGDNHPTKRQEVREKISKARMGKGHPVSEETKAKISAAMKERLKNNPRPAGYYDTTVAKMAEANRNNTKKHQNHGQFMKDKKYAAKPVEYNGVKYPSMVEAIKKTGLSRYIILKGNK
jgi:hypothetical protein